MEKAKKWRKRNRTESVDYWLCPYCGSLNNDGFDAHQADNTVTTDTYTGTCRECSKLVRFYISYLFIAQPLEGEELEEYLSR